MGAAKEIATTMLQKTNAGHFHRPNRTVEGGRETDVVLL
jgi:hypothetical protein